MRESKFLAGLGGKLRVAQQLLERAQEQREWRSKLMTHVRDEDGLRAIRALGESARRLRGAVRFNELLVCVLEILRAGEDFHLDAVRAHPLRACLSVRRS